MSDSNLLGIAATEARDACKGEPDLTQRVLKAMRATKDHWLVTGEVQRLQAACAAAITESPNEDEKTLIADSCRALVEFNNALAAAQHGVPVDFAAMTPPCDGLLPIQKLWEEADRLSYR